MTGLSMEYTEDLQVVNYGIGGHYEPHFDFAMPGDKTEFDDLGVGNRIATVLIYVNISFIAKVTCRTCNFILFFIR